MFCSEQVSGSMKTFRIAGAVGIAALVVALGVGASPAAALAKKHKAAADDGVAGTGVVDSAAAPAAACGTTFSTCCTITALGRLHIERQLYGELGHRDLRCDR